MLHNIVKQNELITIYFFSEDKSECLLENENWCQESLKERDNVTIQQSAKHKLFPAMQHGM